MTDQTKNVDIDKKLFLLDAFALIYRAYFALSGYGRKSGGAQHRFFTSSGIDTSAAFGFTNTLLDLLNNEKPTHIAVVFDAPGQTDRAVEHDFYKANREAMPDGIRDGIPYIKKIIEGFQIPMLELPGYEADDIIGTIAKQAERDGYIVYMVTPDKDFAQLVSDNIFMYKPAYQGKPREILGVEEVKEKWEVERPEQVIDILGMWGDAVDNIPGIPGVGEKTAKKLVGEYGSIEGLYEHTDDLKGKLKEKVENNKEQAFISKHLATIILDAPISVDEDKLVISDPDKELLKEVFAELEFRTLGKRVFGEDFNVNQEGQMDLFGGGDGTSDTSDEVVGGKSLENTEHKYQLVDSPDSRKKLIDQLGQLDSFCFDSETTGIDANDCEIVGLSFSWKAEEGYYVPFPADQGEAQALMNEFKPIFENEKVEKIGQNIKYDITVLRWYGIEVKGALFDTMIAHYLIDPESRHGMDILAERYLGYTPVSIETLIGKKGKNQGNMRDVDPKEVKDYACEDADITLQLKETFAPMIKKDQMGKLFNEVENPLVYVLSDMEYNGVTVDKDFLAEYSKELAEEILTIREEVFAETGVEFNLDSPKQLGEVLFDKMGIPYTGKKTKTGQYSTNEDVLSKVAKEHDIAKQILEYREMTKLKSTYVDALPALINPKTHRIHSNFRQAVAATGRLSSNNPNLQNIPIRTERGRRVRKAFTPRSDEFVLLSADYSQIELRLIASISKDENMMQAFNDGLDIHTATASKVYKVPLEEVTREMRGNAKAVNFGIIYGTSAFGLSQNLNIPRGEAAELIEQYFTQYPKIKDYMDNTIQFAKEHGYVETLLGRRRYLRDINSSNVVVRKSAERNAINAPMQGSAADMIKVAMVDVYKNLRKNSWKSKLILQVHDELVFDAHKDELEDLKPIVEQCMKEALKLDVPLLVEMGAGNDWLEAH